MIAAEPFPLNEEELADVRLGVSSGCVYISMGSQGVKPWCVFHADRCEGHWHLHVQFRNHEFEETLPADKIEEQLVEQLARIKGYAFNSGVKKVMN